MTGLFLKLIELFYDLLLTILCFWTLVWINLKIILDLNGTKSIDLVLMLGVLG